MVTDAARRDRDAALAEEEETTYRAAAELVEGALLIRAMLDEHVLIREIAAHMADATDPAEAGAYGRALFAIFESHQRKENELILPLLIDTGEISLTGVMGAAHGHTHHEHIHDH